MTQTLPANLAILDLHEQQAFGPFLAGLIFALAYSGFLFARMLISGFARRAA